MFRNFELISIKIGLYEFLKLLKNRANYSTGCFVTNGYKRNLHFYNF